MVNVGLGQGRTRFARPRASHISGCPGAISDGRRAQRALFACPGALESKLSEAPGHAKTPHFRAASALLIALRGEDEIRTRGTLETYVGLANRWFQPLTHLSRGTVPRVLSNLFVWSGLQRYKNKLFRNRGGGKRFFADAQNDKGWRSE